MNLFRLISGTIIVVMLISGGFVLAEYNDAPVPAVSDMIPQINKLGLDLDKEAAQKATVNDKHWVYDELAAFKQLMLPVMNSESVSEENKNILRSYIFNEVKLDQVILIDHWALLLGEILRLPHEKADQLLGMYAYGLSTGNEIRREDAVGGMVKLLTIQYMSGQTDSEELKPSRVLKDIESISEGQSILVQKAYIEGILDSEIIDSFRPKDSLTLAEAVSMLYRVMKKYDIDLNDTGNKEVAIYTQQHWASREIETVAQNDNDKCERIKGIKWVILTEKPSETVDYLNAPITVDIWNDLLFYTLKLESTKYDKSFLENYTYGLTKDKFVTRASAVAGMVKLLHAAELIGWRDATEEEKAAAASYFTDYDLVWDQSKFSIAFSQGLIHGYGNSFIPEQNLANGEALALMSRIINKYY